MSDIKEPEAPILVLGAGVVGLTTALTLARAGFKNVQVVAQHMPADHDIEYTSQWAGANWVPVGEEGSIEADWEIATLHELQKLARTKPGAGVTIGDKSSYYRSQDSHPSELNHWFKDLVTDYRILGKDDVPDGVDWGVKYGSVSLDPSIYLHWLQSSCLDLGVRFRRETLSHIREAFLVTSPRPKVVVNCTSLQAAKLGGVNDTKLKPVLGQMVVVANETDATYALLEDGTMDSSIGECAYVIPRPAGGGTALGGCRLKNSWSREPDMELAKRIMQRAIKIAPDLVPKGGGIEDLRVIRHQVGWRPYREGGPRVEKDKLDDQELGSLKLVHAYGLAGFGFQTSYGVAASAVELVKSSLSE